MFRKRLSAAINISAPAKIVWQVLLDFPSYPEWNPFIRSLRGNAAPGARLQITTEPPGFGKLMFSARVESVTPLQQLQWLGRAGLPGILDGRHSFTLEPRGDGTLHFRQEETFAGLLLCTVPRRTQEGFALMNSALKSRAEMLAHRPQPAA